VDKLGGTGAEDMDAEQRPVLQRYEEFQHAVGVTAATVICPQLSGQRIDS
jgi:hypothetical protein